MSTCFSWKVINLETGKIATKLYHTRLQPWISLKSCWVVLLFLYFYFCFFTVEIYVLQFTASKLCLVIRQSFQFGIQFWSGPSWKQGSYFLLEEIVEFNTAWSLSCASTTQVFVTGRPWCMRTSLQRLAGSVKNIP